jgi:SRSO17 transposase
MDFVTVIADVFKTQTRDSSSHARAYLSGLLSRIERKNMERMSESLESTKHQDLQQFISDSPWEAAALWKWTGQEASQVLGGASENMLLIDESGFGKKGTNSVGVARQYNGRLGKVDNCQVGVFSALTHGHRVALVGARLFLPEEWTKDEARMTEVGVPKEQQVYKTRNELAWDLIQQAQTDGLEFGWVGMDAAYGRDQNLLLKTAGAGLKFVADVDVSQLVWAKRPEGQVRPQKIKESGAVRVDALWKAGKSQAVRQTIRSGENGTLTVRFWSRRVWIWPSESEIPMGVWLLMSLRSDGELKYSLSNAPTETPQAELAARQAQRFFIERAFQDGKSELGMGQYQARKWRAWEHHMALVGAAMLFALKERVEAQATSPLTSVRDVVEMVSWHFLKPRTSDEVATAIFKRHERRRRVSECKARRSRKMRVSKVTQ